MTINQLIKNPRIKKSTSQKNRILDFKPFIKGQCLKVFTISPRKPNSAVRKVARVLLSNRKIVSVYIPGEGHNLIEHSSVLIRGGRVKDLPAIYFKVVRGVFDCSGVNKRKNSRSKYGSKKD
ncbi:30S ribosomal protein S12 [PVC group bacterium (ex Bugula neritina AB1)]|nr:30S ribosomal protein S12 [PVC group bacterium (ex Bugula neritina AB1)]